MGPLGVRYVLEFVLLPFGLTGRSPLARLPDVVLGTIALSLWLSSLSLVGYAVLLTLLVLPVALLGCTLL